MKGIIFNAESINAIRDGRKTVTRRVISVQPNQAAISADVKAGYADFWGERSDDGRALLYEHSIPTPYKTGEHVYVKETWNESFRREDSDTLRLLERPLIFDHYIYRADLVDKPIGNMFTTFAPGADRSKFQTMADLHKWKSGTVMPKSAARIFLEIVSVHAERLQDITEDDAEKEGVDAIPSAPASFTHRTAFAGLWDKLHGKKNPWSANPFVWVITFKRVRATR